MKSSYGCKFLWFAESRGCFVSFPIWRETSCIYDAIPFPRLSPRYEKEKLLKSKEIEKKKSEKDRGQEVVVKGSGVKEKGKGFWKTHNLFDYIVI